MLSFFFLSFFPFGKKKSPLCSLPNKTMRFIVDAYVYVKEDNILDNKISIKKKK